MNNDLIVLKTIVYNLQYNNFNNYGQLWEPLIMYSTILSGLLSRIWCTPSSPVNRKLWQRQSKTFGWVLSIMFLVNWNVNTSLQME